MNKYMNKNLIWPVKWPNSLKGIANAMTYQVQDMLDGFSYGYSFSFNKTEKYFLKCIKEAVDEAVKDAVDADRAKTLKILDDFCAKPIVLAKTKGTVRQNGKLVGTIEPVKKSKSHKK